MSLIQSHSYNVAEALGMKGTPKDGIYLGVENEMVCSARSQSTTITAGGGVVSNSASYCCIDCNGITRTAWEAKQNAKLLESTKAATKDTKLEPPLTFNDWYNSISDEAMLKNDSSITPSGFEIVTAPMGVERQKNLWTKVFSGDWAKKSLNANSSCGLHVHVSRAPFTSKDIYLIHYFVNSDKNNKLINTIAGRTSEQWAKKYIKDPHRVESELSGTASTFRYEAVNLSPKKTFEFRIFAGTTDVELIATRLEFVNGLVRWVKLDNPAEKNLTPAHLFNYIKNKSAYSNIQGWMEKNLPEAI